MDPLSVAATCIGLASTIVRTSTAVTGFIHEVREARNDLDAVSRELVSLKTVLEMLADDAKQCPDGIFPQSLANQVDGIVTNCGSVVDQIEELLKSYTGNRAIKGARWSISGRGDMDKLRSSLEAHKSALDIALDMVGLSMTKEIKADTQDIRNDTTAILQEIMKLQAQLPQSNTEFMLQRYLDNLTTYAETSYQDSVVDWQNEVDSLESVEQAPGFEAIVSNKVAEGSTLLPAGVHRNSSALGNSPNRADSPIILPPLQTQSSPQLSLDQLSKSARTVSLNTLQTDPQTYAPLQYKIISQDTLHPSNLWDSSAQANLKKLDRERNLEESMAKGRPCMKLRDAFSLSLLGSLAMRPNTARRSRSSGLIDEDAKIRAIQLENEKRIVEEERRRRLEERKAARRAEEEKQRKLDEERRRLEENEKRIVEEERRRRHEERRAARRAEEEKQRKLDEERIRKEVEEKLRKEAAEKIARHEARKEARILEALIQEQEEARIAEEAERRRRRHERKKLERIERELEKERVLALRGGALKRDHVNTS